jgi:lysyl-tRNA synthetase class I
MSLNLAPLLVPQVLTHRGFPSSDMIPRKVHEAQLDKITIEKMEASAKAITENLAMPLLSVPAGSIESYITQNMDAITSFEINYLEQITKIPDLTKTIMAAMPEITKELESEKIGPAFGKDIHDTFHDALTLELFNENFFTNKFLNNGISNKLDMQAQMSLLFTEFVGAGIDINELFNVSVKLFAVFIGLITGLMDNDSRQEARLRELASLASRYAEEKDSLITTFEITSNKETKAELDEAYREAINQAGQVV